MNAAAMIERIGRQGWGKLDNAEEAFADQQKRVRETLMREAHVVAGAFDSAAGMACLELLVQQLFFATTLMPIGGSIGIEQQAMYQAYRQGQRDVVAMIINAIAVSRGGEAEIQRGEQ